MKLTKEVMAEKAGTWQEIELPVADGVFPENAQILAASPWTLASVAYGLMCGRKLHQADCSVCKAAVVLDSRDQSMFDASRPIVVLCHTCVLALQEPAGGEA